MDAKKPNATQTTYDVVDAIRYMEHIGFTDFVPVYGNRYAVDEKDIKRPIIAWKENRMTADEVVPYAEKGYWVAVVPDDNHIVIDFDLDGFEGTDEFEQAKRRLVDVYGNTLWVETERGIHFYFTYDDVAKGFLNGVSGRHPNMIWYGVDYIKNTRYAIFVGDKRRLHHNPIQPLPEEFYLKLDKNIDKRRCFLTKTEGDRNNSLFEIGRSFRVALMNHFSEAEATDRASSAIERLNAVMKEPLPPSEIRDIQKSLSRPDREDFDVNGSFFRSHKQDTYRRSTPFTDEETMMDNPFTKVLSFSDIQAMRRERRWFMHGLIKHGDVVLVAGAPKSGKSTFMRSIALSCVADTHQPLLTSKGRVLWFVFEEHHEDIADRVELAQRRYGINPDLLHFVVFNPSSMRNPLPYFVAGLRQLLNDMRNDPPVAVIVDTVGRVFGGMDINDYTSVQQALENIRWGIRDFPQPPVIFLVHHTNKSEYKTPLGSQAFQGSADAIFTLDYDEEGAFMQCVGRNVDPSLQHRRIGLRFDPETMLVIGVGELSSGVCELVEKIHSGEISLMKTAENYQGGVFKSDLRRLLRRGILLSDGNNISTNPNHKDLQRYLDGAQKLKERRLGADTNTNENNHKGVIADASILSAEAQEYSSAVVPVAIASLPADSKGTEEHRQGRDEEYNRDICQEQHGYSGNGRNHLSGEACSGERTDSHEGENLHDAEDPSLPAETRTGRTEGTAWTGTEADKGTEVKETDTPEGQPEAYNVAEAEGKNEDAEGENKDDEPKLRIEYVPLSEVLLERKRQKGDKMRFTKDDIPLSTMPEVKQQLKEMGVIMKGKPADMELAFPSAYRASAWRVCYRRLKKYGDGMIPLSAYFPFADTSFTKVELPKNFASLREMWSEVKLELTPDGSNNRNIRKMTDTIMEYLRREFQASEDSPFNIGTEEDVMPVLNAIGTLLSDLKLPIVFVLWLKDEPIPFLFTVKQGKWYIMPINVYHMRKGYLHWLELVREGFLMTAERVQMDERLMWKGFLFYRADEKTEEQAGKPVYILSDKRVEILDTDELFEYLCYVLGLSKEEVRSICNSQKTNDDLSLANTPTV